MSEMSLFVRQNDRHLKVRVQDIQFISAAGSYLNIITATDQFSMTQNLSQFTRKNPVPNFMRVHRSFIVNVDCIDSFDHSFVYIGAHQIPLGASYREKFMKAIHFA